jgi:hypothetical protein
VEKYGDLITNGLDLISFLMVTPEIVKRIAPPTTALMIVLAGSCVAAAPVVLPIIWFEWDAPDWANSPLTAVAMLAIPLGVFIGFAVITPLVFDDLDRTVDRISKHFFGVGVVFFLVSRVLAFYGSVLKLSSAG